MNSKFWTPPFILFSVFTIVYIVLEIAFNAKLLDVASSNSTIDEIKRIELVGRLLSSVGFALIAYKVTTGFARNKVIIPLLVAAIALPTFYFSQKILIDHFASSRSTDDMKNAFFINTLKQGLINEGVKSDVLAYDAEHSDLVESRVILASLGPIFYSNQAVKDEFSGKGGSVISSMLNKEYADLFPAFYNDFYRDFSDNGKVLYEGYKTISDEHNKFISTLPEKADEFWVEYNKALADIPKLMNEYQKKYKYYKTDIMLGFSGPMSQLLEGVRYRNRTPEQAYQAVRNLAYSNAKGWGAKLKFTKIAQSDLVYPTYSDICIEKPRKNSSPVFYWKQSKSWKSFEGVLRGDLDVWCNPGKITTSMHSSNAYRTLNNMVRRNMLFPMSATTLTAVKRDPGAKALLNAMLSKAGISPLMVQWNANQVGVAKRHFYTSMKPYATRGYTASMNKLLGFELEHDMSLSQFFEHPKIQELLFEKVKEAGVDTWFPTGQVIVGLSKSEFHERMKEDIVSSWKAEMRDDFVMIDKNLEDGVVIGGDHIKVLWIPFIVLVISLVMIVANIATFIVHVFNHIMVQNGLSVSKYMLWSMRLLVIIFLLFIPKTFNTHYDDNVNYMNIEEQMSGSNTLFYSSFHWLMRAEPKIASIGSKMDIF